MAIVADEPRAQQPEGLMSRVSGAVTLEFGNFNVEIQTQSVGLFAFILIRALDQGHQLDSGIAVDRQKLQQSWDEQVQSFLAESEMSFPESALQIRGGRNGIHTEHLGHMLCEMQYMQRSMPGLQW